MRTVQEIAAEIEEREKAAYERGVRAGREAAKMDMLRALSPDASPPADPQSEPAQLLPNEIPAALEEAPQVYKRRAPKGLTAKVVRDILRRNFGMTMEQVQEEAVATDPRISKKTVYNELYRDPETYLRSSKGFWFLKKVVAGGAPWTNTPEEREKAEALLQD
jgi:hypothetical protein